MANEVPIWEKLTLTVEETAKYSGIGQNKLYALMNRPDCPFVLYVGDKKRLIKRKEFENYISKTVVLKV